MNIEAVLDSDLGSVVAPAGCGKTHLITEALSIRPQKQYWF
ncbi:PhoH family protein [Photobacterium swingsii]|nr:PhoH family protein [Photobacterium swingsii]